MAGSKAGGKQASLTNKQRYGANFYREIGAKGGKKGEADGTIKGFGANRELARTAGRLGGMKSKRKKVVSEVTPTPFYEGAWLDANSAPTMKRPSFWKRLFRVK